MRVINLIIILLLFQYTCLKGQENLYDLEIINVDPQAQKDLIKNNPGKKYSDSLNIIKHLREVILDMNKDGYMAASFDSLNYDSLNVKAYLYSGPLIKYGMVGIDSIYKPVLRKTGVNIKKLQNSPFDHSGLSRIFEKIISYYENNGYPFASAYLDNISINDSTISGDIRIDRNNLITIDSIYIKGDAKISPQYLYSYIGIEKGDLYNESLVEKTGDRIKELTFLQEIKPFEISFDEKEADIFLYLNNKKANHFNGIIGFLPNNDKTGKLLLTGELNLLLINSFGKGELIRFDWQKPGSLTQKLEAGLEYPYLLTLPVGLDVKFNMFKKDTTFITVNINTGLRYLMKGGSYIKMFMENKNSSLISTWGMENITSLPQYADVNTTLYGLGYSMERFDYKYNPKKGYAVLVNAAIGNKNIKKNSEIPDEVYNEIELSSTQYEGQSALYFFQPLAGNFVLKTSNKTGYMGNVSSGDGSALFENELYKIGGLKTLRGFDEESVFASFFTVFTVECRLVFEQNSSLYLFWDGAYYEKDISSEFVSDYPFGFGAGIDFETKAGIFTLNYALGKQFDNPIELRSAKIHFGFLNRF